MLLNMLLSLLGRLSKQSPEVGYNGFVFSQAGLKATGSKEIETVVNWLVSSNSKQAVNRSKMAEPFCRVRIKPGTFLKVYTPGHFQSIRLNWWENGIKVKGDFMVIPKFSEILSALGDCFFFAFRKRAVIERG